MPQDREAPEHAKTACSGASSVFMTAYAAYSSKYFRAKAERPVRWAGCS